MANNDESADFIHLRLTNAAASSLDEKIIQSIIAGIDDHVSQLNHHIATLRADRAKEIKRRTSYARLISPLRSFPPEILGEIFLYASSGTISSQLVASHVCQLWRHAALGCSELWSKIDGVLPKNEQLLKEYVGACIHRAQSRPLTMIREEGSQYRFPADNGSAAIVDALKRCRWKELSWTNIDCACLNDAIRALTTSPQHSNTLESLKLASFGVPFFLTNVGLEFDFDPVLMDFATFRRLKKLSISLADGVNFNTFNAPWKQLTHFSLSAIDADGDGLLEIVRECTNVEELMLSLTTISTLSDNPYHVGTPVHLSRLRKLHLTSSDEKLFTWITDICVTPALDELVIDAGFTSFELLENQSLCDYLLENAQTIRRLWLSGIGQMGGDEMALIRQLELLEELALVANNSLDEMVFFYPTVPEYTWPPGISSDASDISDKKFNFPHLRGIRIVCPITPHNQYQFLSLVQSRWWPDEEDSDSEMRPIPRLAYASFQERTSDYRMEDMGRLKTLMKRGFSLNMLDPTRNDLKPRFTVF